MASLSILPVMAGPMPRACQGSGKRTTPLPQAFKTGANGTHAVEMPLPCALMAQCVLNPWLAALYAGRLAACRAAGALRVPRQAMVSTWPLHTSIITVWKLFTAPKCWQLSQPAAKCYEQPTPPPLLQGAAGRVYAAAIPGNFDIPAAPILIPEGPWKEIEGCLCAPKGFKAQGNGSCA